MIKVTHDFQSALRLVADEGSRGGKGRIELLEKIAELGSISAAAKTLGISYKSAWEAVEGMNNLADIPLVEKVSGGKHGGGTALTPFGLQVLSAFRRFDGEYRRFLSALREGEDFERFYQWMRRLDMKTSARNEFLGRVKSINKEMLNAEVILDIGGGSELVAIITNESVENLGLEVGVEAFALIKASWVLVAPGDYKLLTSARNKLCGVVSRCLEGLVNGEVVIELPGGKSIAAVVTNESIQSMGLKEGASSCALIKASHVILAVSV